MFDVVVVYVTLLLWFVDVVSDFVVDMHVVVVGVSVGVCFSVDVDG